MTDPIQAQLAAARRHQILDAAAKCFAARGFHPTTIRDIAQEAGVADGTIYNYFDNKSALLLGIFERMKESLIPEETLPPDTGAGVRASLSAFLRYPLLGAEADNFQLFQAVISEIMVDVELRALYQREILEPTLAVAEAQLQAWIDEGQVRPLDPALTARTLSALVLGLICQQIMGDPVLAAKWEALPERLAGLLLDGLQAEGG